MRAQYRQKGREVERAAAGREVGCERGGGGVETEGAEHAREVGGGDDAIAVVVEELEGFFEAGNLRGREGVDCAGGSAGLRAVCGAEGGEMRKARLRGTRGLRRLAEASKTGGAEGWEIP